MAMKSDGSIYTSSTRASRSKIVMRTMYDFFRKRARHEWLLLAESRHDAFRKSLVFLWFAFIRQESREGKNSSQTHK